MLHPGPVISRSAPPARLPGRQARRREMSVTHDVIDSPVGELTLVGDKGTLIGVYFRHHWYVPDRTALGSRADAGFGEASGQLAEYFAGTRQAFDLPAEARGDEFQRRV